MTSKEQLEIVSQFYQSRTEVLEKKAKDYNGVDVLGIFKLLAQAENRTPAQVVLHEIHKKVLRLQNLLASGNSPEFESISDNVMDVANYTDILNCIISE